jgi:hypothetical protein
MGPGGGPTDGARIVQHKTNELLSIVFSECFDFHATRLHDWPLCERAKYVIAERLVTTCVLPVGWRHGHVKGPFLTCSAALVAVAGVRCTFCVGTRERTVCDYGVESSNPPAAAEKVEVVKRAGRWTRRLERVVRCSWWRVWGLTMVVLEMAWWSYSRALFRSIWMLAWPCLPIPW